MAAICYHYDIQLHSLDLLLKPLWPGGNEQIMSSSSFKFKCCVLGIFCSLKLPACIMSPGQAMWSSARAGNPWVTDTRHNTAVMT